MVGRGNGVCKNSNIVYLTFFLFIRRKICNIDYVLFLGVSKVDLIIACMPEGFRFLMILGLPMSFLLGKPTSRITWRLCYGYSHAYLNSGSCMLLFLPDVKNVKNDVRTHANTYVFIIVQDWWGIDELPLCSRVDTTKLVRLFVFSIVGCNLLGL